MLGQTKIDLRTQTKSVDFTGATATKPARMGAALPATCNQGEFFFLSSAPAGQNVYGCSTANTWALEGAAIPQTSLVPSSLNNSGKLLSTDGTSPTWQAAGGDVTGSPSTLKVGGLLGRPLSTATPSDGQLLKFNNSTGKWEPATLAGDVTGTAPASQVVALRGWGLSTATPTDAQLLKFNGTTKIWEPVALGGDINGNPAATTVTALRGRALSAAIPSDGQLLKYNGTTGAWEPIGIAGDVSGAPASLTVAAIQGRTVAPTAPGSGQLMAWSGSANAWTPTTMQIPQNYGVSFSGAIAVSILGTQHALNTANLLTTCYDTSSPPNLIEPNRITVDPVTYNITITFANAQSGRCVVNGSAGGGLGATTLSGSASLTFPLIGSGTCGGELTFTVNGANAGDSVQAGWPALPPGFTGLMRVSASSTIAVRLCNLSGVSSTPPAMNYGALIVRSF